MLTQNTLGLSRPVGISGGDFCFAEAALSEPLIAPKSALRLP